MLEVLRWVEIISTIYLFLIVNYKTTSTTLASSTYILVTRADIREKLVGEMNQNDWNNEDEEQRHEIAMNMHYLYLFVHEVLRMYPVTFKAMTRECNTTTTVCGHIIEKGLFNISHRIL